jgi:hypothetical protein
VKKLFAILLILLFIPLVFAETHNGEIIITEDYISIADARVVYGSYAGLNYGGRNGMDVRTGADGAPSAVSYIKFDLGGLSARQIKSAKLRLCVTDPNRYPSIGVGYVPDSSWIEGSGDGELAPGGGITGENAPASADFLGALPKPAAQYGFTVLDVTGTVIEHTGVISFKLYPTVHLNYPSGYATREDEIPERRPRLIIEKYNYGRIASEIDLSANGFVEKVSGFPSSGEIKAECRDQYGYTLKNEPVTFYSSDAGITFDQNTVNISENVTAQAFTFTAVSGNAENTKIVFLTDEESSRHIDIGDAESEEIHNFTAVNYNRYENRVSLKKDGSFEFDIAVNPVSANYITAKLWGSDATNTCLFLTDAEGKMSPGYGTYLPELDRNAGNSAYPGGYIYSTYLLPKEITENKPQIRLKVYSTGQATPYNSEPYAVQNEDSRSIYGVFSHTNPKFDKSENTAARDEAGIPGNGDGAQYDLLLAELNAGIEKMLGWQVYGSKFDALFAANPELKMFEGMLPFNGAGTAITTKQGWKDANYQRTFTSNLATMNTLYMFAESYKGEWSPHYNDPQMLDRIIKALDFLCIAQGANGGWQSASGAWIGGPDRGNANGSVLEGFGQKGISKALISVYSEIEPYLSEPVDDDDNPDTVAVTRRQAYLNMLVSARGHMADGGHAPNQDAADKLAMYYHNGAVKLLDSASAWENETVMPLLYGAAGLAPNYNGKYWVSEKGIAMEPGGNGGGGYDPGYSVTAAEIIMEIAVLSGDAALLERANNMVNACAAYFYESKDDSGYSIMHTESATGWRNNFNPPRDSSYIFSPGYADKNPYLMKMAQKYLEHGNVYSLGLTVYGAHLVSDIENALELFLNYDNIASAPPVSLLFPYETESFLFTDETAESIVMKNGGERYYITMDWRNKNTGAAPAARVHYMSGRADIVASAEQKTPYGVRKLSVTEFGGYIFMLNSDAAQSYTYNGVTIPPLETVIIPAANGVTASVSAEKTVTVQNTGCGYAKGTLYAVSYENGRLANVKARKLLLKDGETAGLDASDMSGEIKAYYWDDAMRPIFK